MPMTKRELAEQESAREQLRTMLPRGSRIATIDVNAAQRTAPAHIVVLAAMPTSSGRLPDGTWGTLPLPHVTNITWLVSRAVGLRRSKTSMGIVGVYRAEVVNALGYALYGDGQALAGDDL